MIGHEADLTLSLLLLQAHFNPAVSVGAAAAEHDDERPHQPKPCGTRTESTPELQMHLLTKTETTS